MPHDPYRALYLHIPFCKSRCGYCDFTTHAMAKDDPQIDEYIEQLILEIRRKAKEGELAAIDTIYLGGGTPSFIGSARLSSLLYALSLSCDLCKEDLEFTMEANPDSFDERLGKDLWALGVNRLSFGVQSFDEEVLRILGRPHDPDDARRAIAAARERFENISIDLMCAIPGQSEASLIASIEEAIDLKIPHMSIYPLSIEPYTPFDKLVLKGLMDEPDEDTTADAMLLAEKRLTDAGYHRYEVASYALDGYECRHNRAYWTGVPYLGLGLGATTMTQNDERRMRMTDGTIDDDLNRAQMEAEDLMLAMRLSEGVSDERITLARTYLPELPSTLEKLVEEGLIAHEDGRYRPTQKGWLLGNVLYGSFLELA